MPGIEPGPSRVGHLQGKCLTAVISLWLLPLVLFIFQQMPCCPAPALTSSWLVPVVRTLVPGPGAPSLPLGSGQAPSCLGWAFLAPAHLCASGLGPWAIWGLGCCSPHCPLLLSFRVDQSPDVRLTASYGSRQFSLPCSFSRFWVTVHNTWPAEGRKVTAWH